MNTKSLLALALLPLSGLLAAEAPKPMPRQDVIEVPAIRAGLCVGNLFQTHMVLQCDKPLKVWGWAAAGEQVPRSMSAATSCPIPLSLHPAFVVENSQTRRNTTHL